MKSFQYLAFACLTVLPLLGQPDTPIRLGPVISFTDPASDSTGKSIVFGSSVSPTGTVSATIDAYVAVNGSPARNLSSLPSTLSISGVTATSIAPDGSTAVFTDVVEGGEGVELADLRNSAVRRLALDKQGCVRPLALCISCFYFCVTTPHLSPDKRKVIYAVRRNLPFFTVNADGSGPKQLPVYTGALAASPQRVISDSGLVVFTSNAPFGPTFVQASTNVYVMNLDGSGIRKITNFPDSMLVFSSNATISADGGTVVFESIADLSTNSGTGPNQIWTVRSDGSDPRQLTFGAYGIADAGASQPSLSADGSTVAFIQSGQIYLLRTDGKSLKTAVTALKFSTPQSPVLSDDGKAVTFLAGPSAGQPGAVYQINANGSNLHPLYAPRAISPSGVTSAASSFAVPSSGSLFSIYGINFTTADKLTNAEGFPLPRILAGASVAANGIQLPLVTVSPWQINAQLPQSFPPVPTDFQVGFQDGSMTPAVKIAVAETAPAIFSYAVQQAAAFHAGTSIAADADHPAMPGERLEMYGVGLGPTNPPVEGGVASPASPVAQALQSPQVLFGDQPATVLFAGLTPGLAGVYQVNANVPAGLKSGRYQVTWKFQDATAFGNGSIVVK